MTASTRTPRIGRDEDIANQLMSWYEQNRRDLPWRRAQDPYAVWISEIMAQQTRITALLPFYERFMTSFPTLGALASADVDEVLKLWTGLGYYARAHHLHQAAQRMMRDFDGKIPAQEEVLRSLPGIGEYTAAAICSIAFGQPKVPVDGNVSRLFARLQNYQLPINHTRFRQEARCFLTTLVPPMKAGDFAQALMEFGSLVCLPKNPQCPSCPLSLHCLALANGTEKRLPLRPLQKTPREHQLTILLIANGQGEILLRQRRQRLLRGMWEFYSLENWMDAQEIKDNLAALHYTVDSLLELGCSSHAISHMIWRMQGYACQVRESHAVCDYRFFPVEEIRKMAVPTAFRFYRDWLSTPGRQARLAELST